MTVDNALLKPGTIKALFQDDKSNPLYTNPLVQVINIKKLTSPVQQPAPSSTDNKDRYRIIISDGTAYFQGMLGLALNSLVESNQLAIYNLIAIKKFTCNLVKDRKIIIILDIDQSHIISTMNSKIGSPINIEDMLGVKQSNSIHNDIDESTPKLVSQPQITNTVSISHSSDQSQQPFTINTNSPINPISALSPYQNTWTICARVASKSDIRTFTSKKGTEGKVFSVNLLDESGEIKVTCFGDAADMFFPIFEVGKIYQISKGQIRMAQRQFSTVQNDYEIYLDKTSQVIWMPEGPNNKNASKIPKAKYNFVQFSNLGACQKDEIIDVIGIVKQLGELSQITTKATQKQLDKRDLTLVDMSLYSVRITLWGKQAEEASEWNGEPVLALKGVKVSDFNGRTLSTLGSSTISINPDMKESHELRGWYDTIGHKMTLQEFASITINNAFDNTNLNTKASNGLEDRKMIYQIREEQLGQQPDKADYFDLVGTVSFIKPDSTLYYTSCPGVINTGTGTGGTCQKKVVEIGPNLYRCEKCQKTYDHCDYRYIFSFQISDPTGQTWINVFNDVGELVLGKHAVDMAELKQVNPSEYQNILKNAQFKTYIFRVKAKQEIYQGEAKSRVSAFSAQLLDYAKESKMIIDALSQTVIA